MTYAPSKCPECLSPYQPRRHDQQFCGKKCKASSHNRAMLRGRRIYEMAYHWRADRKNSQDQLREMCREIASWIEEDKTNGRKPPARFNPQKRGNVTVY